MLMIHESLMRFRALLSANNLKFTTYLYQNVLFITFTFLLREGLSVLVYLFPLCVKTTVMRPKGSIVWKACIIQLTKVLDFVDLKT